MWLSKFLTVEGISLCMHEGTEHAGSAEEFWSNANHFALGCHYYGNSDSANIFVLQALLAERPMTKVIWIERPMSEVMESMKRARMAFHEQCARTLIEMRDANYALIDFVFKFEHLEHLEACKAIWEICLPGLPFDYARWGIYNVQRICYTAENPSPEKNYSKFLPWAQAEVFSTINK
jgi:hypothetical protein